MLNTYVLRQGINSYVVSKISLNKKSLLAHSMPFMFYDGVIIFEENFSISRQKTQ